MVALNCRKGSVEVLLTSGDFHGDTGKRELGVGTRRETLKSRATLNGKDSERLLSAQNETRENFYATKDFLQLPSERIDIYCDHIILYILWSYYIYIIYY